MRQKNSAKILFVLVFAIFAVFAGIFGTSITSFADDTTTPKLSGTITIKKPTNAGQGEYAMAFADVSELQTSGSYKLISSYVLDADYSLNIYGNKTIKVVITASINNTAGVTENSNLSGEVTYSFLETDVQKKVIQVTFGSAEGNQNGYYLGSIKTTTTSTNAVGQTTNVVPLKLVKIGGQTQTNNGKIAVICAGSVLACGAVLLGVYFAIQHKQKSGKK